MTPNVTFALLDAAVIGGHAEDPVVDAMTHARLLEEVAALGGVLLHLGVRAGVPVAVVLASSGSRVPGAGRVRIVLAGSVPPFAAAELRRLLQV